MGNQSITIFIGNINFIKFRCFSAVSVLQVKCSHEQCQKIQVPALGFSEVCETAFRTGPQNLRKYSQAVRIIINVFLCITQLGFCCVYFVFVAANLVEV